MAVDTHADFFATQHTMKAPILLAAALATWAWTISAVPVETAESVFIHTQPTVGLSDLSTLGTGSYARALKLDNGALVATYTAFAGGSNIIMVTQSLDNGLTWKPRGTVTTGVGDIDNPYMIQLADGRVLCAFRNHSKDRSTGAYTTFRITVTYSDDRGATWKYLTQAATRPGGPLGLWEPCMRVSLVNQNALQMFYSFENAANDQDSIMITSMDGGATWSPPKTISGAGVTARDGMTGVAVVPGNNQHLVCVFESYDTTGMGRIHSVESLDDGATWGNRLLVYQAPSGHAAAPAIATAGETMIVSFMTFEDSADGSESSVKILTGEDGQNWGNKMMLWPTPASWAGLATIDSHTIVSTAGHNNLQMQHLNILS
jgi:hypothetical protein